MPTEGTKDKGDKAGCSDFGSTFKDFQEMFEAMNKCCTGQGGSPDCSGMMKGMMKMCCGRKADNSTADCGSKTGGTKAD